MKKLIHEMIELQDAMNRKVDIDWIEKNREWYRAIWIECGELDGTLWRLEMVEKKEIRI